MALPLFVFLLGGAACDPQGPGAAGQVTLSPAATTDGAITLEIRAYPDDGQPFDPGTVDLSGRVWSAGESLPLTGVEAFPMRYGVVGPMGYTEQQRWRLLAWIATTTAVERPQPGEWYGTRLFDLGKCGGVFPDFCGIAHGIDIEIDSPVAASRVE